MFEPGDKVVHVRHGAGVVIETRTMTYDGKQREYFCIQMNDNRQTLMIPVENMDEDEIRPAITDMSVIEEVFHNEPAELDDNYRTRQANIRQKLKTRSPRKLAQALRDLVWLERTHKLTNTDTRLRDNLIQRLSRELALHPSMTVANARQKLEAMVNAAITDHLDDLDEGDEEATTV
ncbi:MAG: CarD family transcriptional regulator [Anaerolineae bacterium]